MTSQSDHDFVLQLSGEVLRNVQTRVINASLLTHLALNTPLSRVLAQTVSPFQMKAHWAEPNLEIAEDAVTLSAAVQGGARYALEGINLTMEGQVSSTCRPVVIINDDSQPVITLETPSPLDLRLGDLELAYAGDDELPTFVDTAIERTAIERTLLRPTLCTQLMAPLANLPLNCLPDAVPLHLTDERLTDERLTDEPDHATPSPEGLVFTDAAISLDPGAESLTLTMACAACTVPAAPLPNLLAEHSTANAAVALSETGLNRILEWLCAHSLAAGTTPTTAPRDDSVSWRWEHVVASFTDNAIHLTGELWQGDTATVVDAEMRCSLTSSARLSVQPTTSKPQPVGTDVLIDAWALLLRRTFFAATRPPGTAYLPGAAPDSDQPLLQRFVIPGIELFTDASAVNLELRHGYLVAWYAIPPDEQPFTLTLEEKEPKPTIVQSVVPLQDAPGTLVTAQLTATLASSPEPPYDYVWRVDQELRPRLDHGPTVAVTKTPFPAVATGEPQKLAAVKLKVIDILGQVGETEADAMYYPATNQDQETSQDSKKEAKVTPDNAGLFASMARFYRKWKERHKTATAVLRVTGPAVVSAIVAVTFAFLAIPRVVNPSSGALPSPVPVPHTSTEFPSSGDPSAPPTSSTRNGGQTNMNDSVDPPLSTFAGRGGPGPNGPGGPGPGGPGPGGPGPGGPGPDDSGPGDPGSRSTGSVQIHTQGAGIVTSQPSGISCPPTCSADFPTGTAVRLTAAPSTTSVFSGWDGSCRGTNTTCQVRIFDARAAARATFTPKPRLTVEVSDGGSVTGSGISCPPTCSVMVNPGESIALTAQPDPYYDFEAWDGGSSDVCPPTTPTCTVVMNGDRTLSADFRSQIAPFIGTWRNIDPNTRSITQVKLTQNSPSTATLHVWGACVPTWCDWGTTTATLSAGKLEAFYDQGFATRTIFISLANDRLIVRMHTHFTDDSGRQDYSTKDIMEKV